MREGQGKRVVVIGAGMVGASLAYHLARKSADVTLVEAEDIASGVTGRSFAWLTTSHPESDPIAQLRAGAIEEYRRLEIQLPSLNIRWTGALSYSVMPVPASVDSPSTNRLSRSQILELEPNLKNPPESALFAPQEGALDAVAATHALVAGAKLYGATVLTQTRVLSLVTQSGDVSGVQTTRGFIDADVVVMAAGTSITTLTDSLGVSLPITASPAILIRYTTEPNLVNTLISNSEIEVRHCADGTLLAAEDYLDDTPENQPAAIALRTARAIRSELHGVTRIVAQSARIGLRPVPADNIPIIGFLPTVGGVYVCVMHPGVTLAAIAGRLASEEIMDGETCSALIPCRPHRFVRA